MERSLFQVRVGQWTHDCFGPTISFDKKERNHRFLEEALELVQACGCTEAEAHQLVGYVYGRPVGEIQQELGGAMVTLAALANAHGISMDFAADNELDRARANIANIREKQKKKPKYGPLPEAPATVPVACIEQDGCTLYLDASKLLDMSWLDGDGGQKYTLTFKTMFREDFEALGEFEGF